MIRRAPHGAGGLTLIEVLVALTVLAVAGGALAYVQLAALRSGATVRERHVVAEALGQELLYQRVGPAALPGACSVARLQHGWQCEVTASCPVASLGCQLQLVQVVVTPQEGPPATGVTVRFHPGPGAP